MFLLPVADRSVRKQAINPKKLHTIDWALGFPFAPETRIDSGRRLETAVYLHARREREDLAYVGGEREIDLVLGAEHPQALINVALSLTEDASWQREIDALIWAGQKMPGVRRMLVTHERGGRCAPEGIEIVNAWQYLLGSP